MENIKGFITHFGEIVAKVHEVTEDGEAYILEKALAIVQVKQGNQIGNTLAPITQFSAGDPIKGLNFILKDAHVYAEYEVSDELKNAYIQIITGIDLSAAPQGSLIL